LNKDGFVDDQDLTFAGYPTNPEIIYGFGFNLKYKKIDLGVFFQGADRVSFNLLVKNTYLIPGSLGSIGNILSNADDRWTQENPSQDVFYPRLSTSGNGNNNQPSTWWLQDGKFIRLKNLELGYTPFSGQKNAFKNTRFFLRGSNLLTWAPFKLWDPELMGEGFRRYPLSRYMSVGLELNF
jgi:hypothetical protein